MPELPETKGVRILRAGIHLGEVREKNAVPDHAAALCFRPPEIRTVDLDAGQAVKFLGGETIPGEETGWVLLRYEGIAVGWGKGSGGTIRNHYPKGLRGQRFLP